MHLWAVKVHLHFFPEPPEKQKARQVLQPEVPSPVARICNTHPQASRSGQMCAPRHLRDIVHGPIVNDREDMASVVKKVYKVSIRKICERGND